MAYTLVSWKSMVEPTNDAGTAYHIVVETTMRDGEHVQTVLSEQTAANLAAVASTGNPATIAAAAVDTANGL